MTEQASDNQPFKTGSARHPQAEVGKAMMARVRETGVVISVTLIAAVAAGLVATTVIALLAPSAPADFSTFIQSTTLLASDFKPEPREATTYLAFLVTLALSLLLALRLPLTFLAHPALTAISLLGLCLLVFGSITFASAGGWDTSLYSVLFRTEMLATFPAPVLLTVGFLGFIAYRDELSAMVLPLAVVLIVITALVMQLSQNDNMAISPHFLILTAPLVEVVSGRTLLVDLPGQYGLWPHFLEPWFRIVGLSVTKVALTFNGITLVSLGLVYYFFHRCVQQPAIRLAGFASLMSLSVYLGRYIVLDDTGIVDPYYQFWSVRIFFPALLIAMVVLQQRLGAYSFALPGTVLFTLGHFWNLDTGLPCLLVWLVVQLYLLGGTRHNGWRPRLYALAKHLLVAGITSGVIVTYLWLRAGQPPDLTKLILFQQLFAQYGYYMLPMPALHPWNLVVIIYALAIAYALRHPGQKAIVLMLGLLGFGLMPYYIGRSHELVFLMVMFPAIMLVTLFVDVVLTRLRDEKQFTIHSVAAVLLGALLVTTASSLLVKLPALGQVTLHRIAQMQRPPYERTEQVVALYQQAMVGRTPGAGIVFLSHHATFWHLVTQSRVIVSDEYLGFVFRDQYEALAQSIAALKPPIMLEQNYARDADSAYEVFHPDRQALVNQLVELGYRPQLALPDASFQYWDIADSNAH